MELKRREFIAGAAVAGLSAFACGLAGCAAPRGNDAPAAQSTDSDDKPEAFEAAETVETDIVIVGAGISGLAAAVQAGHNKDRVIVLEASPTPGGAGGVEGIFGWNSPIQRELGIDFSKSEVLTAEVKKNNYVTDGERWNDTIKASGENIQWLLEQGAEFTGVVDNYHNTCLYDTFHWWKGGHASEGYIPPMLAKAEALGVTFRTKTRAKALIVNESTVTGLYAELEDGSILQVNAGAVVLAAGGFVGNTELLLSQMNITERDMAKKCLEVAALMNRVGDGVLMARDIGAQLYPNTCMEGGVSPRTCLSGTLPCIMAPPSANQDSCTISSHRFYSQEPRSGSTRTLSASSTSRPRSPRSNERFPRENITKTITRSSTRQRSIRSSATTQQSNPPSNS